MSCGDGVVDETEQCDDKNLVNGDGCSEKCLTEPQQNVCGNGITESPEQCDDGNTQNLDGCSASCQLESNVNNSDVNN